jgi:hypothetical protein
MTRANCIAFVRNLGDLVASRRAAPAGSPQLAGSHAEECEACQRRLVAAVRLAEAMRERPSVPGPLRSPKFFESICESVVRELEGPGGTEGAVARAFLLPVPVPDFSAADCLEPTRKADLGGEARRDLRQDLVPGSSSAPSWLWHAIRSQIRRDVDIKKRSARRARRMVMAFSVAAAALVFVVARISLSKGTHPAPEIVFQDVQDMPLVEFSPVAVLRNGGVR